MEGRRARETSRVERGREQRRAEWIRLIWWVIGIMLVVLFMTQNNLMNATGILAVLGSVEVVARVWKHLGDKMSGE